MQHDAESTLAGSDRCQLNSESVIDVRRSTGVDRIEPQHRGTQDGQKQDCGATSPLTGSIPQPPLKTVQVVCRNEDPYADFSDDLIYADLQPGKVVLDLATRSGPAAFLAAPIVGPQGRVISIAADPAWLTVARQTLPEFAARLGYSNLEFRRGRMHDLQLDLEQLENWLQSHPARSSTDWLQTEATAQQLRRTTPLVAADSIDVVLSDFAGCQIEYSDRPQVFAELQRVLRRGGRAVVRAIVSDEDVPSERLESLNPNDPLNGAYREDLLLEAFEIAGFHGIEIVRRQAEPLECRSGIEFRWLTVRAFKGKAGPCLERNQAVIYKGPWKAVIDDDGHTLFRGKRMAVCDKTFNIYSQAPYAADVIPIPAAEEIPLAQAATFDCRKNALRAPRDTKHAPTAGLPLLPLSEGCGPDGCC